MKRLGILGTLVWDTIWTLEDQAAGRPFESWGGMAYSLAAGAASLPSRWEITPIARVGADLFDRAHEFLDTLPGVGPRTAVVRAEVPNNRVELRYLDEARRDERLTGGVPAWSWEELAPHLQGLDALYLNFFSGYELGLDVAERIALEFHGPVYADLHSLFLDPPGDGPRRHRPLADWQRWLGCFDLVQLNEDERAMLGGGAIPRRQPPAELLEHGPDAVLVTLGPDGAVYAASDPAQPRRGLRPGHRLHDGEWGEAPAAERVEGGDPTGCGDVWGITVFAGLIGGLPLHDAVARANGLAAVKLEHRGAAGLCEHLLERELDWQDLRVMR